MQSWQEGETNIKEIWSGGFRRINERRTGESLQEHQSTRVGRKILKNIKPYEEGRRGIAKGRSGRKKSIDRANRNPGSLANFLMGELFSKAEQRAEESRWYDTEWRKKSI